MQPNLAHTPPPAVTDLTGPQSVPLLAAYGLALSLTIATATSSSELHTKATLVPANVTTSKNTNATSLRQEVLVASAPNPLELLIQRIHAKIPDDVWVTLHPTFSEDVDDLVNDS